MSRRQVNLPGVQRWRASIYRDRSPRPAARIWSAFQAHSSPAGWAFTTPSWMRSGRDRSGAAPRVHRADRHALGPGFAAHPGSLALIVTARVGRTGLPAGGFVPIGASTS
jgi:hypothetical protein